MLLVLIISWPTFTKKVLAKDPNLQLKLSDSVSIYSEKAYRRDGGTYFEAVGNVVISSGKDTLYGEKASFNTKTGLVEIEGSVRYISDKITIYGSKIIHNTITDYLEMNNSRMITKEFSIVSEKLIKKGKGVYFATEAEFTTCKDCTESWKVYGKKVEIELNQYVQIYHALLKVKGIDVLYLPYIALPIKNERESGVLFPSISTRNNEGVYYEQPLYWAISEARDLTFSPLFYSERGYGADIEYRDYYNEKNWVEFYSKSVNDKIYEPLNPNTDGGGPSYFRYFLDLENYHQWNNSINHHFKITGMKDLDFVRDYSFFTEEKYNKPDVGANFNIVKRHDLVSLGFEGQYRRSLLENDPEKFSDNYVQILPTISGSLKPIMLWQHDGNYFYKSSFALDADYTVFKQNKVDETEYIRNARRLDVSPVLKLNILSYGPLVLKTKYQLDYQEYDLVEEEDFFSKNSGFISTELSFTVDKIFGLSYQEIYDRSEIPEKDLPKFTNKKNIQQNVLSRSVIGELPEFESSIVKEKFKVLRNSYRHSQEYKFIHHKLVHASENGNQAFNDQVSSEEGWFDYRDAITEDILDLNSEESIKQIPLINTFELQWNNTLVRKSPKVFNYLVDNRFLKDNFNYKKLGHFNISQGYLLNTETNDFKSNLTRLFLDSGYYASSWSINIKDYYDHQNSDHLFTFSGQKRFNIMSFLTQYNYNSYPGSNLKTVKGGIQLRPIDVFGVAFLKEHDLDADENITSIYQVDFMPNNNCWILNFNYKESLDEQRYAFNFEFNFGNDEFKEYRNNFFNFNRLK